MEQSSSISKLAGSVGGLLAIVGLLTVIAAALSFVPRTFLFVGIGMIVLSFVAFAVEEFGPRR
jgi:hypothetical protein